MAHFKSNDGQAIDITLLSTADWDYPFWTNKQHVARSLVSQGCRVLYVDSLGLRSPRLESSDLRRILKRILGAFKGPRLMERNLWVCSPLLLPAPRNRALVLLNSWVLKLQVYLCHLRINFRRHILWTYNPALLDFIAHPNLTYRQTVYHCVDNIAAQPCMDSYTLEEKEKHLCQHADAVFVTSQALYSKLNHLNPHTYLYPNVADITHFSRARGSAMILPRDLSDLTGPIIGFIGAISAYKLDFGLIAQIARYKADCNFVFIGRIGEGDSSTDVSALSDLPNMHFIGAKPYSELPMYLHWFDIALLPCLINDYTTYMFPMKFFEYVAAGVPVVTTNLPSLQNYARYANICSDEESFLYMINHILSFPKGVGPRAAIPLEELPPWCGYDERTKLMLQDLEQLASHGIQLNQAHDDR